MLVDYAFSRPSVDALKAAGARGVSRYLSWLPNSKVVDVAEYRSLVAAGIDVVLNWEYDAKDFVNPGFDAVKAAAEALRQARALGHPDDGVIYYSVDWDVKADEWPTIAARFRAGPNKAHGVARTGIYGPWDALAWAKRDGVANWFWQSMSTSFSGKRNAQLWPGAHLRQRRQATIDDADCDLSDIIQPYYGQRTGGTNVATLDGLQAVQLANSEAMLAGLRDDVDVITGLNDGTRDVSVPNLLHRRLASIDASVRALLELPARVLTDADRAAIVAGIATSLPTASEIAAELAAQLPKPPTAAQIAEEMAARLGNG